jgi:hypothetical protein
LGGDQGSVREVQAFGEREESATACRGAIQLGCLQPDVLLRRRRALTTV